MAEVEQNQSFRKQLAVSITTASNATCNEPAHAQQFLKIKSMIQLLGTNIEAATVGMHSTDLLPNPKLEAALAASYLSSGATVSRGGGGGDGSSSETESASEKASVTTNHKHKTDSTSRSAPAVIKEGDNDDSLWNVLTIRQLGASTKNTIIDSMAFIGFKLAVHEMTLVTPSGPPGVWNQYVDSIPESPLFSNVIVTRMNSKIFFNRTPTALLNAYRGLIKGYHHSNFTVGKVDREGKIVVTSFAANVTVVEGCDDIELCQVDIGGEKMLFGDYPRREKQSQLLLTTGWLKISEIEANRIMDGNFNILFKRAPSTTLSKEPSVKVLFCGSQMVTNMMKEGDPPRWCRADMENIIGNYIIEFPGGSYYAHIIRCTSLSHSLMLGPLGVEVDENISRSEFLKNLIHMDNCWFKLFDSYVTQTDSMNPAGL
jgi:hypothetical protein